MPPVSRLAMPSFRVTLFLVAWATGLLIPTLAAGGYAPIGPAGGRVEAVTIDPVDPATLYAGTNSGAIFKSTDGGRNWRALDTGALFVSQVRSILVDPSDRDTVYVVATNRIARSRDGGATWTNASPGVTGVINAAVIDPTNPNRLYVGTSRLYRSENRGDSWTQFNNSELSGGLILSVVVDPTQSQTVYARKGGCSIGIVCAVFKTIDGGAHWQPSAAEITTAASVLEIDPSRPATLYLHPKTLSCQGVAGCGIFKTVNGGGQWNPVNQGLPNTSVRAFAFDPLQSSELYVALLGQGVYRSVDGGLNWVAVEASPHPTIESLAIDPTDPNHIYLGTITNGVLESVNGGLAFQEINTGLFGLGVSAFASPTSDISRFYVATNYGGVYRSDDGGSRWTQLGLQNRLLSALLIDPSNPLILYASSLNEGVSKSVDGGQTWNPMNTGLEATTLSVLDLAIDPANPNVVYAAISGDAAFNNGGVFRSSNGGMTWQPARTGLGNQFSNVVEIDPSNPQTLYAGTGIGLFKSTNGAGSWSPVNQGLGSPAPFIGTVQVDPANSANVFLQAFLPDQFGLPVVPAVFASVDGGASWQRLNPPGLGDVSVFQIDPRASRRRLATVGDAFYRSLDSGAHWKRIDSPVRPVQVAFDPRDPDFGLFNLSSGRSVQSFPAPGWLFAAGNPDGLPPQFDGFAFSNLTNREGVGRLQEFSGSAAPAGDDSATDGTPILERASVTRLADLTLPADRQIALTRGQLFPGDNGLAPAWIEARIDEAAASFFQFGAADLSQLDGGVAVTQPARRFYLRRICDGAGTFRGRAARTRISVFNPNTQPVTLDLTYFPPIPAAAALRRTLGIPARGFVNERASTLFGGANLSGGYILGEITAGGPVAAFEVLQLTQTSTVLGSNASTEGLGRRFYSAQLAGDTNLFTEINLINTSRESRTVTLNAIAENGGALAAPVQLVLEPGGQLTRDARDLFGLAPGVTFVGSLRGEADRAGVLGGVIFGDPVQARYAASLQLQEEAFTEAVFSQVANVPGFFTGLAFYYPGDFEGSPASVDIEIEVVLANGMVVGRSTRNLARGARLSQLVDQLVPASAGQAGGFIRIHATQPVIAQMLFVAADNTGIRLFSAVPPAVVQ